MLFLTSRAYEYNELLSGSSVCTAPRHRPSCWVCTGVFWDGDEMMNMSEKTTTMVCFTHAKNQ
jgi:hypothetical protein